MNCICQLIKKYMQHKNLKKCNQENTTLFSFNAYKCKVKVIDVYDGDTFTGCFYYNSHLYTYKFRCLGYDSPEIEIQKYAKQSKPNNATFN